VRQKCGTIKMQGWEIEDWRSKTINAEAEKVRNAVHFS